MRTWILFGSVLIAYSINPKLQLPLNLVCLMCFLFGVGIIFDMMDRKGI